MILRGNASERPAPAGLPTLATRGLALFSAAEAEAKVQAAAALDQERAGLAGKIITAQDKVVKVNNSVVL